MKTLLYTLLAMLALASCSKEEEVVTPPAPNKYTLTITADTGGSVSSPGGTYNEGSKITVTATPDGEYLFDSWSDGSTENPREITVTSNLNLTAKFVKKKYSLTVSIEGEGTVTEEVIIQGSTSETTYNAGTTVRLTATPNEGWVFAGWSGDVESEELVIEVPIEKGTSVSALFKRDSFELNITIEGEGTVKEEVIVQPGQYDYETVVRLTAIPADGWNKFSGWSGDIVSNDLVIELSLIETRNLTASFTDSSILTNFNSIEPEIDGNSYGFARSFTIVSGVFTYSANDEFYAFYPGAANWVAGASTNETKNDIPPMPSQVLKRVNGKWEYFKTDNDAYFWGARNFKIIDNIVAIGDGNEIGPDGPGWDSEEEITERNWSGDTYYGEIQQDGNIFWKKVNDLSNRSYYHGTTLGDINGDGLLDVGGSPNPGTNNLKLFTQSSDGSFEVADNLLSLVDGKHPFTLEFYDLDGDHIDEIITADYGGGDPTQDSSLNNIKVYKYNDFEEEFKIAFESNSPDALYSIGMGATSIKCADFDNDGIYDISVAREDYAGQSVDIWKGDSDGSFSPHFATPIWGNSELSFREFSLLDVNNDGYLDIVLRPFMYGSLYRYEKSGDSVEESNGIILNTIIQINDGNGRFAPYDKEDLIIEGLNVDNVHPYMDNGVLHFVGTYPPDRGNTFTLETVDIKVRIR